MILKTFRRCYLLVVVFLIPLIASSQPQPETTNDSAALLHQNGQIYLVVLVLSTIFAGILTMLVVMERKLNKLEKELNK